MNKSTRATCRLETRVPAERLTEVRFSPDGVETETSAAVVLDRATAHPRHGTLAASSGTMPPVTRLSTMPSATLVNTLEIPKMIVPAVHSELTEITAFDSTVRLNTNETSERRR